MIARMLAAPLDALDLVFVDTETTGFSPRMGGELVELAGVRCRAGVVVGTFQRLIKPTSSIPGHVTAIHGITNAMVRKAPPVAQVLPEFLRFIDGAVLGFHNAPFDLAFLTAACDRGGHLFPPLPIVDTLRMSRRLNSGISHSLDNLVITFGIEREESHRALADATAALELFHIMVERAFPGRTPTLGELDGLALYPGKGNR